MNVQSKKPHSIHQTSLAKNKQENFCDLFASFLQFPSVSWAVVQNSSANVEEKGNSIQ